MKHPSKPVIQVGMIISHYSKPMLIMKSYVHHKLQLHCEHKLINMVKQECVPNTKWSSQHSRNAIEKQAGQWFHTLSGWSFALSGWFIDENNYITEVTILHFVAPYPQENKCSGWVRLPVWFWWENGTVNVFLAPEWIMLGYPLRWLYGHIYYLLAKTKL